MVYIIEICDFCGQDINHVAGMIRSPRCKTYICGRCANIAAKTIGNNQTKVKDEENKKGKKEPAEMKVAGSRLKNNKFALGLTPSRIHQELDRFIIGQEKAKKILSVAVYNHNKRLNDKTGLIKKSNVLLIGPSGCGKTLLARTLAKMLNVPFVIIDATSLTEAGYVGDDVEVCLQRLIQTANGDIELAQKGIVYIDEIDKIARKGESRSLTRDVSGEGVQASLLKLIEGCEVSVPVKERRKHPNGENVIFNTSNVLFICSGSFEGLFENTGTNKKMGFLATRNQISDEKQPSLTPDTLVKYGMIPELVGRLPILCLLDELSEDDLVRILTEPEDAITKEYQLLFKKDGVKLVYEEDALREIAKTAISRKTGARGLRSIIEDVMLDIMYHIPESKENISKCIITKESIITKEPVIIPKRRRKPAVAAAVSP